MNAETLNLLKKLGEAYFIYTTAGTILIPGAIEILESLKDKYILSILSNGFKEVQYMKLNNSGLLNYFQHVIVSEEIGELKPNKQIFDASLRLSNCEAKSALMIGDNLEADIKGSLAAGWQAIYFNRFSSINFDSGDDYIEVSDLNSISYYL